MTSCKFLPDQINHNQFILGFEAARMKTYWSLEDGSGRRGGLVSSSDKWLSGRRKRLHSASRPFVKSYHHEHKPWDTSGYQFIQQKRRKQSRGLLVIISWIYALWENGLVIQQFGCLVKFVSSCKSGRFTHEILGNFQTSPCFRQRAAFLSLEDWNLAGFRLVAVATLAPFVGCEHHLRLTFYCLRLTHLKWES